MVMATKHRHLLSIDAACFSHQVARTHFNCATDPLLSLLITTTSPDPSPSTVSSL
jgi:hypothetical protein